MKNLSKFVAVLLLITAFSAKSNAQFKFSAGAELGYALEEGFGLMYGASIGGEYAMGDKAGITAQVGYILNSVDAAGMDSYSAAFVPMQLGYKYYFDSNESGPYAHLQLGMHMMMVSYEYTFESYSGYDPITFQPIYTTETISESTSDTYLSYGFGGGFLVNEHIDLGLRYNIVSAEGGSFNYIGARVAYVF